MKPEYFIRSPLIVLTLILLLPGCHRSVPKKSDYIGVYRVIKVVQDGETIKFPPLNQIELTENIYISSFDRNGDNRFSGNEISKSTYLFKVDKKGTPAIRVTGNSYDVLLLPDRYYDLKMKRTDESGVETTLFLRKVSNSTDSKKGQEDYLGVYKLIKIRENGKILNLGTLARIELTDELYISEIDRNGDGRISNDEIAATAYSFHKEGVDKPYILINRQKEKVELLRDDQYDLLLRKVDGMGNETIMYLKR